MIAANTLNSQEVIPSVKIKLDEFSLRFAKELTGLALSRKVKKTLDRLRIK